MLKEETPEQRKRVLIIGWTMIIAAFVLCALAVLSIRPNESETTRPETTNSVAK